MQIFVKILPLKGYRYSRLNEARVFRQTFFQPLSVKTSFTRLCGYGTYGQTLSNGPFDLDLSAPKDLESPCIRVSFRAGGSRCHGTSPLVTIPLHEATEFTEPHVSQQGLSHSLICLTPHRTPATVVRQPHAEPNHERQPWSRQPLAKQRAPVRYTLPISVFHMSSYSYPTSLHLLRTSQPKHSFNQNAVPIYRFSPHLCHSTVPPHHN